MKTVLAYDFGTSGLKAAMLDEQFSVVRTGYAPIQTFGDGKPFSEQRPWEWAAAFTQTTKELMQAGGNEITGICISGHSLGIVPVFRERSTKLPETFLTPIWSDHRATAEAKRFFDIIDRDSWYKLTGNGFSPEMYAAFKLMWIKANQPELYDAADCFIGSKDYLNYLITGTPVTDRSYASGSGLYDLRRHGYVKKYIKAAGLEKSKLPVISASEAPVGYTVGEFCLDCGLPEGIPVYAGGVDNVCAAVGSGAVNAGDSCISLGSSAQFVKVTKKPEPDATRSVFVWDMASAGNYATSVGTMSACTSLRRVVNDYYPELQGDYCAFDALAAKAGPGSGGVLFYPEAFRGKETWKNCSEQTTKAEIARSVLEGIAFSVLKVSGISLEQIDTEKELRICGGGSRSPVWMQMFADVFGMTVTVPAEMDNCAAIGAAMLSSKNICGIDIRDVSTKITMAGSRYEPDPVLFKRYRDAFGRYLEMEEWYGRC
jgi:xylulokinase